MRFSEDFLSELRARTDIEELIGKYTDIKHRGSRTPVALCPFHTEKTPSFVIYRDTQSYYCFGCGAGGDAITFVKNIERLDYTEAVRYLCEKAGMNMPLDNADDEITRLRRRCNEANREAAKFYHSCLSLPDAQQVRDYLDRRELTRETIIHFGLGFAPDKWDELTKHMKQCGFNENELIAFDLARRTKNGGTIDAFRNRLMFPIIDLRGNVIAFGGRVLDDSKPKYLNTSDTVIYKKSQAMYALNFAKNNSDGRLILCEGYMDVIAMHQAGFTNAVAGLGTAFTNEQISLLSRYCNELLLAFDSDEAGVKATNRALKMLSHSDIKLRVLHFSGGKDPDEIIRTQGAARMKEIINGSVNDTEFALQNAKAKYDLATEDGRLGYLNDAVLILAEINNAIERDIYISRIASELDVTKQALEAQISKRLKNRKKNEQRREFEAAFNNAAGNAAVRSPNPERREHLRAAKAEEIILASLLKHPDYLRSLGKKLSADTFVTSYNRDMFTDISRRISEGRSVDISAFADGENEQVQYISYLLSMSHSLANTCGECEECIQTLLEEKAKKSIPDVASLSDEDFRAMFKNIKKHDK